MTGTRSNQQFTLFCSGMKSERPRTAWPAETIVDAGFDRIDRHAVTSEKDAAVTAETEVVVLDLRTPVVPEGIFRPDASHPAAGGSPAAAEGRVDADISPGPPHLAIDKPVIESITEPRGQRGNRVTFELDRDRAERPEVVFHTRP